MANGNGRGCKRSRAWHRARWREHVEACAASGLSGAAYCRRHGLHRKSFYRWRRIFSQPAEEARSGCVPDGDAGRPLFAEVRLPDTGSTGIEVCVAGGRLVRVAPGFDAATLCRVVSALEGMGASC
jgi:transposase-like protein